MPGWIPAKDIFQQTVGKRCGAIVRREGKKLTKAPTPNGVWPIRRRVFFRTSNGPSGPAYWLTDEHRLSTTSAGSLVAEAKNDFYKAKL